MTIKIFLLICVTSGFTQTTYYSVEEEYQAKILKNEPTCHLIDKVPHHWTIFPVRNCMCDEECQIYKDCCKDSIYHEIINQTEPALFQCHPTAKIYMITSCPSNYTLSSVKEKCESYRKPLKNNRKIIIPVTSISNITYANEYCAVCNNEYFYVSWTLTPGCSQIFNGSDFNITETTTAATTTNSSDIFYDEYVNDLNEAKKRITFDHKTQSHISFYNDKIYECWYTLTQPKDLLSIARACIPFISTCANLAHELQEICQSYTSVMRDTDKSLERFYKNSDCASCNNATNIVSSNEIPERVSGSSLFSTRDKASGT